MSLEKPIKSWSYSALRMGEQCPYRLYLNRVERVPAPERGPDHPLARGERIHKLAEEYITGVIGTVPKELVKVAERLDHLRAAHQEGRVEVEQEWGFKQDWSPTSWGAGCWGYIKQDVVEHVSPFHIETTDWKTGKSLGKEVSGYQQMSIYAMSAFMKYPEVLTVKTNLAYTDEGKDVPRTFLRTQVPVLLPKLEARIAKHTSRTDFPPKPNIHNCRYCDYGVANGNGRCVYAVGDE